MFKIRIKYDVFQRKLLKFYHIFKILYMIYRVYSVIEFITQSYDFILTILDLLKL